MLPGLHARHPRARDAERQRSCEPARTGRGSLHAVAARGILWGNRGALLDERGRLARRSRGLGWVCCVLEFHGRRRDQWRPGRLTELYVLDEPTALAAGHRPCGECRSADHRRFREAWTQTFPADTTAALVDRRLHAARLVAPGVHRTYEAPLATLPDGTLVEHDDGAWLVAGKRVLRWSFEGYGEPLVRESLPGIVTVRTPAPTVAALAAGYVPLLHPSALRAAD